jgi:hypothetical protein
MDLPNMRELKELNQQQELLMQDMDEEKIQEDIAE